MARRVLSEGILSGEDVVEEVAHAPTSWRLIGAGLSWSAGEINKDSWRGSYR
jgi:hypothetical protein